jgi:hypothetical protein
VAAAETLLHWNFSFAFHADKGRGAHFCSSEVLLQSQITTDWLVLSAGRLIHLVGSFPHFSSCKLVS